MNKKIFLTLVLVSGMAFAQNRPGSAPDQQQQQPPSGQQTQPSTTQKSPTSAGQNSLTGCLKGSGDSWVLVSEGQSTPISGDSSKLKQHNNHQVQLKGQQASDGSFQVTDVVMIAESCAPGR
jgi:hypothetical protein